MNRPKRPARPGPRTPPPLSGPLFNPSHEAFCLLVAKGLKLADAYRQVYPKSKLWKDSTLHPKASRLMGKVWARVEELRAAMTSKDVWSVQEKLEALAEKGRRALQGFRNIMVVLPDGTQILDINETNADLIRKATTRIDTSGRGDGKADAAFVTAELVDDLSYMQEHSKLAGHYPDPKLVHQNPDGTALEFAEIVIVDTHATNGIDPTADET